MADTIDLVIALAARDAASAVFRNFEGLLSGLPGIASVAAGGLLAVGAAAAAAFGASVAQAANFQTSMVQVQNNTTMTTADAQAMHDSILTLANDTGAPLDQLAQGYMHISNFGYDAADAQTILQAATESAMSTGGNAASVAEVLANVMHEFSIKTTNAGGAMDVLHLAAAQGNMTLEQFTDAAGPMLGIAANLGVPLTDAAAAMSALTRHGYDASQAATQVKDVLTHIVNPSKGAKDELERLSKVTGIDLVGDFSEAGLKAKGLNGVLMDVQKATGGNAEEIMKLIPALRGGLGAITLVGTGMQDYNDILGSLADTYAGKTTPTADAFARSQGTLGFQLGLLKANLQTSAIEMGEHFLPQLTQGVEWLQTTGIPGFKAFTQVAGPALASAFSAVAGVAEQALGGDVVGAVHTVLAAVGAVLPGLLAQLEQWGQAFIGWLAPRVPVLLNQLLQLQVQIGQWILGTAVPVLAQDAMQLGAAITDWAQAQWPVLMGYLGTLMGQLGDWISGTALPEISDSLHTWAQAFADWIPGATQNMVDQLGPALDALGTWIFGTGIPALRADLAQWGHEFVTFVAPQIPPLLAELAKLLVELTGWILLVALPQIVIHLAEWGIELIKWVAPRIIPLILELAKLLFALTDWVNNTAIPDTITAFALMGQAIITGILQGLQTLATELTDAIKKAFESIDINVGPFHLSASGFTIDPPTFPSVSVPGFAGGTSSAPGGLALVGESGPELINLPRGASVTPMSALGMTGRSGAFGAGGNAGVVVNINVTRNTMLGSDSQTARTLASILKPELDRLVRLHA